MEPLHVRIPLVSSYDAHALYRPKYLEQDLAQGEGIFGGTQLILHGLGDLAQASTGPCGVGMPLLYQDFDIVANTVVVCVNTKKRAIIEVTARVSRKRGGRVVR